MLAELTIDESGGIKRTRFFNAVMKSHARLTYSQAWEMLSEPQSSLRKDHDDVVEGLDTLYELYKVLRAARERRGVIEFESTETRIVFDDNRKIEEILPVHRNDAHKLIEECMILANIAAAAFIERQKIPALYRVHQGPKSDRLEDLRAFLTFRGLTLGGGDAPAPIDYARLSKAIAERADRSIVETTMLRSMQQAVYQPKNEGHFGLALTQYAHFTSPIRRYPDLLVHRAIKFSLLRKDIELYDYSMSDMQVLGESCSSAERRADEASRDVLSWLKCEYMQSHVGDEFDGVINTVTSFGLFVELNDLHVEGLVHITSLVKDYYRFEQAEGGLIGEKTGREYHLGEPIRVQVAAVNLDDRKIDFQEVDTGDRVKKKRKKSDEVMDPKVRQKKPSKSKSQKRRDKQRLKTKLKRIKKDDKKKGDKKTSKHRDKDAYRSSSQSTEHDSKKSHAASAKKPETKSRKKPEEWKKPSAKSEDFKKPSEKSGSNKRKASAKDDSKKPEQWKKPVSKPNDTTKSEDQASSDQRKSRDTHKGKKPASSASVKKESGDKRRGSSKKAASKKRSSDRSSTSKKRSSTRKPHARDEQGKSSKKRTAKKTDSKKVSKKVAKKFSGKKRTTKKTSSKKSFSKKRVVKKTAKKFSKKSSSKPRSTSKKTTSKKRMTKKRVTKKPLSKKKQKK